MMRKQFALADVLFGCVMAAAILSLLSISVARSRAAARVTNCSMHMKMLGLAVHNYHDSFRQLPVGAGGTDSGSDAKPKVGNAGRLSAFVAMLPFMEEQELWEQIQNRRLTQKGFPAMGPVPWYDPQMYPPWAARPNVLLCQQEPDAKLFPIASSYVLNYGDGVQDVGKGRSDWPSPRDARSHQIQRSVCRGVFSKQVKYGFRDILDGTSNTMMMSEMQMQGTKVAKGVAGLASKPSLAITAQDGKDFWPDGRSSAWCDGSLRSIGFQSILPPGSPSATSDRGETSAVMSASSYHGDGANILMSDGGVFYVTSSIDCGDSDAPSVFMPDPKGNVPHTHPGAKSPYGLWGALGTRASKEYITVELGDSGSTQPARRGSDAAALAELQTQPTQTLLLADKQTRVTGWVLSCSPEGKVEFVSRDGKHSRFTLSDLDSESAYGIVSVIAEKKIAARKLLLPQLEESLALLEDKKFNEFIDRFVDKDKVAKGEINSIEVVKQVYQSRGTLIQHLDEMIAVVKSSPRQVLIETNGVGETIVQFQNRGRRKFKGFSFRDGRWYWQFR